MPAMTPAQTSDYISHHLKLAGRSDTLFSDDATALVHDAARGLPRAVNNIATQALVAAMAERKNIVDEQSARIAVSRDHVRLTITAPPRTPRPRRLTPAGPYSHPHMLTVDDAFVLILSDRAHQDGLTASQAPDEFVHGADCIGVCRSHRRLPKRWRREHR